MRRMYFFAGVIGGLVAFGATKAANAQTVFANFEDGTTDGFGTLTNSGYSATPFSGDSQAVITPGSGGDTTKVLDLTAAGYNGGGGSGTDLGYDFTTSTDSLNAGLPNVMFVATSGGHSVTVSVTPEVAAFLSNDVLSFNWETASNSSTGGYSQIYQTTFTSYINGTYNQYTGVGGYGTIGGNSGSSTDSEGDTISGTVGQNPPFSSQLNTVSINYDAFKAQLLANIVASDSAPVSIGFGITTNNGGGAPADFYFDNFTLSAVPEPASLSLLGLGGLGLLARRRKA